MMTAKHLSKETQAPGKGEGFTNHCRFGHQAGAPTRVACATARTAASMSNLKEPDDLPSLFTEPLDTFEKVSVLKTHPVTIGALRLDGAPIERSTELDAMASIFGSSVEHPVLHDHATMGAVEGHHTRTGDLMGGMTSDDIEIDPSIKYGERERRATICVSKKSNVDSEGSSSSSSSSSYGPRR
jgi:hypothetical protein